MDLNKLSHGGLWLLITLLSLGDVMISQTAGANGQGRCLTALTAIAAGVEDALHQVRTKLDGSPDGLAVEKEGR